MLYFKCVWLFVVGGLLGVVIESLWWRLRYGFSQFHVTLIWLPLCTVYSFGAIVCYLGALLLDGQNIVVRFLTFSIIGSVVEFIGGFLLDRGMQMRAWDYTGTFLNIRGYVNLMMTVIWGVLGIGFEQLMPEIDLLFDRIPANILWPTTIPLMIFLAVDMIVTSACLARWSKRHQGVQAKTRLDRLIDRKYGDERMRRRFNNWHFNDEPDLSRTRPGKQQEEKRW